MAPQGRICGTGEMADRIRNRDWSCTTLGSIAGWSETLVACVNVMLASPGTYALFWGPEQVLLYNDEYTGLLHEKHPLALGRPGSEVWSEAWQIIGPQIDTAYRNQVTTRVAEALIPIIAEGRLRDGWFTYGFFPIYEAGRVVAVGNTGREITEEVTTREGLRQTHEKLQLAMEFAGQGAFLYEEVTGLITVDPGTRDLFELPDLSGPAAYWISKVHPDDGERVMQAFAEAVSGRGTYDLEHRVLRSDGVRWLRARARRISASGAPVVLTGICEDITQRHLADEERRLTAERLHLAQSEALLHTEKLAAVGRLASVISHEINNPLEAVTNLLYIVRSSPSLSREDREHLELADKELARVSQITAQTLRQNRTVDRPEMIDADRIVQELVTLFRSRLAASKIRIKLNLQEGIAFSAYEGDIRQVLNILIANAFDAMRNGGVLQIRSRWAIDHRSKRKGVSISVADSGAGVPPGLQGRLFDAFYTTKGINGIGLGLWTAKRVLQKHDGTMTFRSSTGKHHGSVFRLWLPLAG